MVKKRKIKTPKRILDRQKEDVEELRQHNLEWYNTHPGWWGTRTGEMLKKYWKLSEQEVNKGDEE